MIWEAAFYSISNDLGGNLCIYINQRDWSQFVSFLTGGLIVSTLVSGSSGRDCGRDCEVIYPHNYYSKSDCKG